jgi:membrane protein DedA with SNARE-associated domain
MDEEQLVDAVVDLPQVVHDIAEVVPVEAWPVDPLPVHALSWFARLLAFFAHHAYLLTFFGAMVENTILLGFLLPGGAVVALAGAGGRQASLSLPALVILAAAGMCVGAVIDYYLGRAGIARILRHRWMGIWGTRFAEQLEQAEPLLRRHGWWIMLMAHAFGTGRSSLAVAAGASGLPLRRFLAMEAPAALLWSAVYAGGGYMLAAQWSTFELILRRLGWIGTLGMVALIVGWVIWNKRRSRGGTPVGPAAPAGSVGGVNGVNGVGGAATRAYVPAVRAAPPLGAEPAGQPAEPVR